jgi:cell division septation protein DedD
MKTTCPRCGKENELDESKNVDARRRASCASCGGGLSGGAAVRRAGRYDGYAVGRRVLKFVPAWLLMCVACFVAVLLLFKWASRPIGEAGAREEEFKNEATNRPAPTPTPSDSHANAKPSDRTRVDASRGQESPTGETGDEPATEETGAKVVSEAEESASFSVQAGAFDDRSQANELVSSIRASGFDARIVDAGDARRFRFQVRSGLFQTHEEAARLAAQLRSKGVAVETVIVEPNQK